jgi:serine/threonine protein kinase
MEREIGRGNYSTVYKYKNNVLKKLKQEEGSYSCLESSAELSILFSLSSPYLIKGLDIYVMGPELCIETETLYPLTNHLMEYTDIKKVCFQLISGLYHLHSHNYLHLDISLYNCMFNIYNGQIIAKLIDFGMACKVGRDSCGQIIPVKTTFERITLIYRPWENLIGDNTYSDKSDVWSLGMVYLELLTKIKFDNVIKKYVINGEIDWHKSTLEYLKYDIYKAEMRNLIYRHFDISTEEYNNINIIINKMINRNVKERYSSLNVLQDPFFSSFLEGNIAQEEENKYSILLSEDIYPYINKIEETCLSLFPNECVQLLISAVDIFIRYKMNKDIEEDVIYTCVMIAYRLYNLYSEIPFVNEKIISSFEKEKIISSFEKEKHVIFTLKNKIDSVNIYDLSLYYEDLLLLYISFFRKGCLTYTTDYIENFVKRNVNYRKKEKNVSISFFLSEINSPFMTGLYMLHNKMKNENIMLFILSHELYFLVDKNIFSLSVDMSKEEIISTCIFIAKNGIIEEKYLSFHPFFDKDKVKELCFRLKADDFSIKDLASKYENLPLMDRPTFI